ncbi:MAG: 30S ribosomal protein S1 [Gammaproteobacteria bacterium]|nr:30S ribosomal protein S1 [Gammaproteobacteria bacterium]
MSESFAELLEESLAGVQMQPGAITEATVLAIDGDLVIVNAGLKSEGVISLDEFRDASGAVELAVGDVVEVVVEALEDGFGETIMSREKAKRAKAWTVLEKAFEANEIITGMITEKVKGGFTVMFDDIRAFLPGSLVDVRPLRDTTHLEGKDLEFKCIKLDRKRNNVVVSRRAVVEAENSHERDALLENLQEGQVLKGVVKNLTDYGAFVDLGGIDGLLHITDMSWKRIKHPSEMVNVGDELEVAVLKFDRERSRVSLGLKQLGEDPWQNLTGRYPVGSQLCGTVTNITEYGCFVEITDGVEGLVHMSEMDWTNRNINPAKVVQLGQEVDVMILELDESRRRISLGMKQCAANPWEEFAALHRKGDQITGTIKSITDFGLFVELAGGIDGLVHMSDISWAEDGEEAIRHYKKGDEVTAVVLLVDTQRERISLGVKQIDQDPVGEFVTAHPKGSIVPCTVTSVDARGAVCELANSVEGYIRVSEISRERVNEATDALKVGDELEAMIIQVDAKNRSIQLSLKAKDMKDESSAMEEYSAAQEITGTTNLGDLLKKQMNSEVDD